MKPYLILAVLVSLLVWATMYGFNKTVDSRCAYYEKLNIEDVKLCGIQKGKK